MENKMIDRTQPKFTCTFGEIDSPKYSSTAKTLATVQFGDHGGRPRISDGVPVLPIHMVHDHESGFAENWMTTGNVTAGEFDDLVYAHDDERMFCAGHIASADSYADETRKAYSSAFDLIDHLGFPKLFRMWNYIGSINRSNSGGLEIYRDFCLGRSQAFSAYSKEIPAATGVGTLGGGVSFYFFSCRSGIATHIENPRQVPAYKYPTEYGPKSPTFARATHVAPPGHSPASGALFVAGTASILGHETVNVGDIDRQCDVALSNIAFLVGSRNLSAYHADLGYNLADMQQIKVYVRRTDDLLVVQDRCRRSFSPDAEITYLNVDICRQDLLVEIEGMFAATPATG